MSTTNFNSSIALMVHNPLVVLEVVIVFVVMFMMYIRPPSNIFPFIRKLGLLLVVLVHIRSLLDDCHLHVDKVIGMSNENEASSHLKQLNRKTLLLVNANNRMMRVLARRVAKEGGIVIQTCSPSEYDMCGERDEDYDDDGYALGTVMSALNRILGRNVLPPSSIDTLSIENYQIYKYSLDMGNFTNIKQFSELMKGSFPFIDMIVINSDTVYSG